jgi:serine protease DegQ
MRRLWLFFAQAVTVSLAVFFVLGFFRPDLLPWRKGVVTVQQAQSDKPVQAAARPDSAPIMPVSRVGTTPFLSFRPAVERATPSVVNIFTSKEVQTNPMLDHPMFRRWFGDDFDGGNGGGPAQRQSSLGSGVIVSEKGYVLTNHHVIEAADEIQVALSDGRKAEAVVVGADPESDLAVLKVNVKDLPAITFGSSDTLGVGDVVLAIGNPFGVGQTVTMGIVSAVGRSHLGINTFENFIQTDAAINPGNSGGALVDAQGNLLGINTAIYSRSGGSQGIGFTIPVSLAKHVMEQIIQSGSVTRGWIGVEVQDVTPELAESLKLHGADGAIIAGVLRGGPADKAGVKPGDVLVAVNGKGVKDSANMLNLVAALAPGKSADLKFLRAEKPIDLQVTVGKRPKPQRTQREE